MSSDEQAARWLTFDLDDDPGSVRGARAGLTEDEIKEGRRLLRTGETASDPRVARLVVALAAEERSHDFALVVSWVVAIGFAIFAVARIVTSPLDDTTFSAVGGALVFVPSVIAWSRTRRRATAAEHDNRRVLELHRVTPAIAIDAKPKGVVRALLETSRYAIPAGVITSVLQALVEGKHVTLAVLSRGLVYGGILLSVTLVRAWYRAHPLD